MIRKLKEWLGIKTYPNKYWFDDAQDATVNTPDILELETRPMQLLFLPCECQENNIKGVLTSQGGVRLFDAVIKGHSLYTERETGKAILLPGSHVVKGELWTMLSNHLSLLDKYKENGVQCTRRLLEIVAYGDNSQPHRVDAWVYQGVQEYWDTRIDNGYRYPLADIHRLDHPLLQSTFLHYSPAETKLAA